LGFQIFKTSVAANEFGFFLISLLNAYPDIQERRNDFFLFLDNASSHKAGAIKNLLKQFNLCYSAPYSPFLNPIEEMFSTWKHYFRKLMHDSNDTCVNNICISSKHITSKKLMDYYIHSLEYLKKSLLKEDIE